MKSSFTESMKARERVLRALNHQEVDRAPIDLGGSQVTTMCSGAYESFKQFLGATAPTVMLSEAFDTVKMDESVLRRLPVDTRPIYARPPAVSKMRRLNEDSFVDEWGVTFRRPAGSRQFDMVAHPLAEATIDDLERFPWPDLEDPTRYVGLREEARALHEGTDYAVCGSTGDTTIFDRAWMLRGMTQFLCDLLADEEFALALLEKVAALQYRRQECFLKEVGSYLDVLVIADDMAAQNGPLISPKLYRKMVKPFHRRYAEVIRRGTGAKILNHVCGGVTDLIEDYIDIGYDALNPMQVSAAGMAPQTLKSICAGRMAFWGGIDTQWVLPQGNPDDVRRAVRETLESMEAGRGGYVLAAVHNVQDDVPPENVFAMLEEGNSIAGPRNPGRT